MLTMLEIPKPEIGLRTQILNGHIVVKCGNAWLHTNVEDTPFPPLLIPKGAKSPIYNPNWRDYPKLVELLKGCTASLVGQSLVINTKDHGRLRFIQTKDIPINPKCIWTEHHWFVADATMICLSRIPALYHTFFDFNKTYRSQVLQLPLT